MSRRCIRRPRRRPRKCRTSSSPPSPLAPWASLLLHLAATTGSQTATAFIGDLRTDPRHRRVSPPFVARDDRCADGPRRHWQCLLASRRASKLQTRTRIVQRYPPHESSSSSSPLFLPHVLTTLDPQRFPTSSQARKACRCGEVIVLRRRDGGVIDAAEEEGPSLDGTLVDGLLSEVDEDGCAVLFLGAPSTVVLPGDAVLLQTRADDEGMTIYPQSRTGYVYPPDLDVVPPTVPYEDDDLAIVDKPEGLVTVGRAREDLQSVLPYVLRPPLPGGQLRLPRPVHRLDRWTSGLVVVAKTDRALTELSRSFAERSVQKSYVALVFGEEEAPDEGKGRWNLADYPIDGREATTLWRVLRSRTVIGKSSSFSSPQTAVQRPWTLSLVEARPLTGRYHQVRRHLAYCAGTPIVGDGKYDGGGDIARSLREPDGSFFLCSNAVELPHPFYSEECTVTTDPRKTTEGPGSMKLDDRPGILATRASSYEDGDCLRGSWCVQKSEESLERVVLRVEIPLPTKFSRMMEHNFSSSL